MYKVNPPGQLVLVLCLKESRIYFILVCTKLFARRLRQPNAINEFAAKAA